MPLPEPKKNERYKEFMKRFLKDEEVQKDYPDRKQRFAVGASQWNRNKPQSKRLRK